jgi:hypothetical protein
MSCGMIFQHVILTRLFYGTEIFDNEAIIWNRDFHVKRTLHTDSRTYCLSTAPEKIHHNYISTLRITHQQHTQHHYDTNTIKRQYSSWCETFTD